MNGAATNISTTCVSNINLKILRFLRDNPNSSIKAIHAQKFYELYPLHMELILLEKDGLIQTDPYLKPELHDWISNINYTVSLSSKGVAYLDAFEREQQWRKEQIDPIKEIANSAKDEAESARKAARKADIKGWIALIVSIFVAIVDFIANFDKIKDFFCGLF